MRTKTRYVKNGDVYFNSNLIIYAAVKANLELVSAKTFIVLLLHGVILKMLYTKKNSSVCMNVK